MVIMNGDTRRTLLTVLPLLPLIARTTILHLLRLSQTSHYVSLRTSLIVTCIRAILVPSRPQSVSAVQKLSTRDPGVKGRIWIANYAAPAPPELDIQHALLHAVGALADGPLPKTFRIPDVVPVEAEWTGYRAGVAQDAPLPDISERERYEALMAECTEPTTVLYFHGGAFYLLDPASHRPATKRLAKLTGGRCYSVRYRLAPQHPFPSALLDALLSYLTLLYPPPDAYHEPVKPEHIVIAGDSAGGNLSLALLQLIHFFRRENTKILWHGEHRQVPLPAGVAVSSPWLDITQSSPQWSVKTPTPFDYLPKLELIENAPKPPCDAWPALPPRRRLYVDDALAAHPLASLTMNPSWADSPPIWLCTGWEILAYEDKFLVSKLKADGVAVRFEEYEAMAHCFALVMPKIAESVRCFEGWSGFIRDVVRDPASMVSSAVTIRAKSLEEVPRKFEELCDVSEEEMREKVLAQVGVREGLDFTAKL